MKRITSMSVMLVTLTIQAAPAPEAAPWSKSTNGLQVRIVLVEKPKFDGTRQLVPYLELKNASDSAHPLKVRCDGAHVKFELIDPNGKIVRDGHSLPRSGPHADPGAVVLPFDSEMRIGMYCSNWGVPKDAPAMISTDSGAWVLQQQEKGAVILKMTIKGAKVEPERDRIWHGRIEATVKVDWKDGQ